MYEWGELKIGDFRFETLGDDGMPADQIAMIDRKVLDRVGHRLEFDQVETKVVGDTVHCRFDVKSYVWLGKGDE